MLRINDKDYSITFSCYFNVEWPEKRLRLDSEFGREQVRKSRLSSTLIDFLWRSFTFLLTGGTGCQYHGKSRHYSANEPGVCQGAVAAQHLHLQPQNLQGNPKQSMTFPNLSFQRILMLVKTMTTTKYHNYLLQLLFLDIHLFNQCDDF